MFEKRLILLTTLEGDSYRIFEESFARRFGEGEAFTEEDRLILKNSWTNQAKAYYVGLQPQTANRLLAIGSDQAKISAPITHDAAFLDQAWQELTTKKMEMLNLYNA